MLLADNHIGYFGDGAIGQRKHTTSQNTASISFQFSYKTSADSQPTSDDATMFLTPALNIVFSQSLNVVFDPTLCLATGNEVTTWSLGNGDGNFDVFVWKSAWDIQNVIIPSIQDLIDEQQALARHATSATDYLDASIKISTLSTAKQGWQSQLDRIADLNVMADAGSLQSTAASIVKSFSVGSAVVQNLINVDRTAGLVAPNLLEPVDGSTVFLKNTDGSVAALSDVTAVESISAFSFSGGGASITFADTQSTASSSGGGSAVHNHIDNSLELMIQFKVRA